MSVDRYFMYQFQCDMVACDEFVEFHDVANMRHALTLARASGWVMRGRWHFCCEAHVSGSRGTVRATTARRPSLATSRRGVGDA